ncbi:MAG: type II toxin-antitoxin system Phd/YefM family antitoxin [Chloroflexota bacterium]|nr:type II toxin-antitoxin system Phd/YefM family antitoxin [Chloroflexota bacterium]
MIGQEKTIGAFEARRQFGKVLQDVTTKRGPYIVEKNGEPIAAVVPIETYNQMKRRREAFFERLRATAAQAELSDEEAMRLATEAVQAVRADKTRV